MNEIYRTWKGRREFAERDCYVRQRLIQEGRLKGCYETITAEYESEEQAIQAQIDAEDQD